MNTRLVHAGISKIPSTHGHKQSREILETQDRRRPWYHASSQQPASLNGTKPLEHGALSFISTFPSTPSVCTTERPLGVNAVPLISEQKVKSSFTFGNRDDLTTMPIRTFSCCFLGNSPVYRTGFCNLTAFVFILLLGFCFIEQETNRLSCVFHKNTMPSLNIKKFDRLKIN